MSKKMDPPINGDRCITHELTAKPLLAWICHDCGLKHGRDSKSEACVHIGECHWCKKEKVVTQSRDYGYPEMPD